MSLRIVCIQKRNVIMNKMPLNEIHYKRFIETLTKDYDKIWTIEMLLNKINFLLPSNIEMTETSLRVLIYKQHHFKIFKCKVSNKTYYIFKRNLPRE